MRLVVGLVLLLALAPGVVAAGEFTEFMNERQTKILVLIPLMSVFIVMIRILVGLQLYGVFGPLIIAFSLVEAGILEGLLLYSALLVVGLFFKLFIERFKFPLICDIALLMFVLATTIILISYFVEALNLLSAKILFPLIITSFLIERFSQTLQGHSLRDALNILVVTLAIAVVMALVGQAFLALNTWWLLGGAAISLVGVIILGNYVGLRLTEVFRFKLLNENDKTNGP